MSVVMPVLDGHEYLERSLPALRAALEKAEESGLPAPEFIAVDDGSRDDSRALLERAGACVLRSGGRMLGPAHARNIGAGTACGDVIVFVDCDVSVHEDALVRMNSAFDSPEVVAAYGSYDSSPAHGGFASQYMNLRHHHIHQSPSDDADTWWAGLGAVRRAALVAVDGFDSRLFGRPSIEDIELGRRLRRFGRIRRVPEIQGSHLKRWTLLEVVRTDVLRRALPWAQLMSRHPGAFQDLNVGPAERLRCLVALAFLASLSLSVLRPRLLLAAVALFLAAVLVQRPLARLFLRVNGAWFALRALAFHQLYYAYAAATYVGVSALHRLRPRQRSSPSAPSC